MKFSRKLDQSGRIMIPIKIREKMNLVPGEEYDFCTKIEDGRKLIVIDCGPADELENAIKLLEENGMKIITDPEKE